MTETSNVISINTIEKKEDSILNPLKRLTGMNGLSEKMEVINKFVLEFQKLNPLEQAIVKDDAIKFLKNAGFSAPGAIIDQAIRELKRTKEDCSNSDLVEETVCWHEPVDGSELCDKLVEKFSQYVSMKKKYIIAIILWLFHAHTHDACLKSPILNLFSPEKRCGKTTAVGILKLLVPKPFVASNTTKAVVFRCIDQNKPTLLIDEADTFIGKDKEMVGILNSGHDRATAYVARSVGDDYHPKLFSTWAAKVIAGIGKMPETIKDRSIMIRMRRKLKSEQIKKLNKAAIDSFKIYGQKIARWAKDHQAQLESADPVLPDKIQDRQYDNWMPLVAIADLLGDEWPTVARDVAVKITQDSFDEVSYGEELLSDIHTCFKENGVDRIPSENLTNYLGNLELRQWSEWKSGRPMTARQLAQALNTFDIKPKTIRLNSDITVKGYTLSQFEDAFARYLPTETKNP